MKWFLPVSLAAAVLAGIGAGLLFRGTFEQNVIVMLILFWIGIPVFLLLGGWALASRLRKRPVPKWIATLGIIGVSLTVCLIISLIVGKSVHQREIQEAHDYIDGVVPKLEAFHDEHGRYPAHLEEADLPSPPALLAESHSYYGDESHFRFEFLDHASIMRGFSFDSESREWKEF